MIPEGAWEDDGDNWMRELRLFRPCFLRAHARSTQRLRAGARRRSRHKGRHNGHNRLLQHCATSSRPLRSPLPTVKSPASADRKPATCQTDSPDRCRLAPARSGAVASSPRLKALAAIRRDCPAPRRPQSPPVESAMRVRCRSPSALHQGALPIPSALHSGRRPARRSGSTCHRS